MWLADDRNTSDTDGQECGYLLFRVRLDELQMSLPAGAWGEIGRAGQGKSASYLSHRGGGKTDVKVLYAVFVVSEGNLDGNRDAKEQ